MSDIEVEEKKIKNLAERDLGKLFLIKNPIVPENKSLIEYGYIRKFNHSLEDNINSNVYFADRPNSYRFNKRRKCYLVET